MRTRALAGPPAEPEEGETARGLAPQATVSSNLSRLGSACTWGSRRPAVQNESGRCARAAPLYAPHSCWQGPRPATSANNRLRGLRAANATDLREQEERHARRRHLHREIVGAVGAERLDERAGDAAGGTDPRRRERVVLQGFRA